MDNQTVYESEKENFDEFEKKEVIEDFSNKNEILNPEIDELIENYSKGLISSKLGYTPIHIDEIASRLARFYEKIRKIVDWKDDNALKRSAIERILKRILFPKLSGFAVRDFEIDKLAETVTHELIRGGHLPNDTVPQERIAVVSKALNKYMYFLEYTSTYKPFEVKQKINFTTFVIEIAACEIEEILTNPIKEQGLIKAMTKILNKRISVESNKEITPEEKLKQINIATMRSLYDLDDNYIIYQLLKKEYPDWQNLSHESIDEISKKLPQKWDLLQKEITKPITRKFFSIAKRVKTVFTLIDDVLEKLKDEPKEIKTFFDDKKKFTQLITKSYDKRYQTLKTRLLHLAIFSSLSVFLSNWVTFYLVEIPLAKLFYEGFNLFAAIVDFLIPTAIMFFLVALIKPPKEDNIKRVISATLGFVYQDEKKENYQIRMENKRFSIFRIIMILFYVISTFSLFAGIAYIFYISGLPMTSVIFDTFTISLSVFAAVVIKNKSKELNIDEHATIQDFLLDLVTLPVAKVGSVIARKWKEYNIVAIFFNFIFETPFAVILNFIQGWSEYINEKRTELH